MPGMILADLRRIMRKKGFYITLLILLIFLLLDKVGTALVDADEVINRDMRRTGGIYILIPLIFIILSVFGDDERSRTPLSLIGCGITRQALIIGKMIDGTVLMCIYFVLAAPVKYGMIRLLGVPLSDRQIRLLMFFHAFCFLRAIACLALSMLAFVLLESLIPANITAVMVSLFTSNIFRLVQTVYHIDIFRATSLGLVEEAHANLSVGNMPWQLLPLFIFYICLPVLAAALVYRNKELEL